MVILIIKIAISGLKIDGAVYICKWTTTRHPDATVGSFGDGAPHGLQCECPGVVHKEPARLPTVVPLQGPHTGSHDRAASRCVVCAPAYCNCSRPCFCGISGMPFDFAGQI